MKQTSKPNKCKIALIAERSSSPTLFTALQIAYGLCGKWERIIVIGSSDNDCRYQHVGHYSTLYIPHDSTPQRYMDLLNIVGACGKDVIILSSLSDEWKCGVTKHLSSSLYEEILKSHNTFMSVIRHYPHHIIGCIETERTFIKMNTEGVPKIHLSRETVQQPTFEKSFTSVLRIDKKGKAELVKDLSQTLPTQSFYPTYQMGAMLQDWCHDGKSYVPEDLQKKINECNTLGELYQLLFEMDIDDIELLEAFTRRRLELQETKDDVKMEVVAGGLQ